MTVTYAKNRHPTLRRGASGEAVTRMQRHLAKKLPDLDPAKFADGIFGPGTEFQVKRFQKKAGLVQDGVVGLSSWTALLREETDTAPAGKSSAPADHTESPATNNAAGDLAARIRRAVLNKGYQWFDDGKPYALNIVGVRSASDRINAFDDKLYVVYRDDACQERVLEASITTDPGHHYTRVKLLNDDGAAILVPGQYVGAYATGLHRGKYKALVQKGKVRVWRDKNKDERLDRDGKVHEGWFGINIHRASAQGTTANIGKYSAGCQVFQNADKFAAFMTLAEKSEARRKERLTYTLLEASDLP